jgi:shikimate 5-dehydrogenase
MISTSLVTKEVYHLFGFPIAHSASPAFHNYIFSRLGLYERTYKLTPMAHIGEEIREICRAKDFGGASVTMPLKVTVGCILDEVTDEARAIGAVNTLVQECDERDKKMLVGTNTYGTTLL